MRAVLGLALAAVALILLASYGVNQYYQISYPRKYTGLVEEACRQKQLDEALVYAVIRTESGFDPQAQSAVGARGLMQLMPDAYDWIRMRQGKQGEADYELLFDPVENIECGTEMLRILLEEFGSVENALCAYHAGWGSAKQWLADPQYAPDGKQITRIPFADTRAYVEKVTKTMERYRKLYELP